MAPFEAAREATAEIALPVLATTLSLVVIFIPVSFMSSISGRFLYQFGFTAACAILVSLLVSFTLTPMMSARMFQPRRHGAPRPRRRALARAGSTAASTASTPRVLAAALRPPRRWSPASRCWSSLSAIPLYRDGAAGVHADRRRRSEFEMSITAPEGTSVAAMDDAMRAIEAELQNDPRHPARCSTTIAGGPFGTVNEAQVVRRRSRRTRSASSR